MTAEQREELATIRKAMRNLHEFYEKHIKGKSFEEIDPEDWEYYSDWYKDMYGFRPRLKR